VWLDIGGATTMMIRRGWCKESTLFDMVGVETLDIAAGAYGNEYVVPEERLYAISIAGSTMYSPIVDDTKPFNVVDYT
jgi:hypothetical protein